MGDYKPYLFVLALAIAACGNNPKSSDDVVTNNSTNNSNNSNNIDVNNANTNNANNVNNANNRHTNNGPGCSEVGGSSLSTPRTNHEPPRCSDECPPPACNESIDTIDWRFASVVSSFELLNDAENAHDYTGDDEPDNMFGPSVLQTLRIADQNTQIQAMIEDGSYVLVLHYRGLDELSGGEYLLGFWRGEWDGIEELSAQGGNPILVDSSSSDPACQDCAWPAYYVGDSILAVNQVSSGYYSRLPLPMVVFGSMLEVPLMGATIAADVVVENTSVEGGIGLANGRIGGVVRAADFFRTLNEFADENCKCLDLAGPLTSWNTETRSGTCNGTADGDACRAEGKEDCALLVDACPVVMARGSVALDVDTDGDETPDGWSMATKFTAYGAVVTGITPPPTP